MVKVVDGSFSHIVVTYLGNRMPKYVVKNLVYLRNTFPSKKLILITDLTENLEIARKNEINVFEVPPWISWSSTLANLKHSKEFRNGFWLLTLYRFKAIETFLKSHPDISILQVEADVLVSSNFTLSDALTPQTQLAFPFVSKSAACPSVMYIRNLESLSKFINFIETTLMKDSNATDMSLLATYANSNDLIVTKLVSEPSLANNRIYDGATYGMFLAGVDPNNTRGLTKLFYDVEEHAIKASKYKYTLKNGELRVDFGEFSSELLCLHIHCKDEAYFSGEWPPIKLQRRIKQVGKGHRTEVNFRILIKLSVQKCRKSLLNFLPREA